MSTSLSLQIEMTVSDYNDIVRQYKNRLCRYAEKMLKNRHVAIDVAQESFMKLWENRNKVDPQKVHAWLYATAYNHCLTIIKKERRYVDAEALNHFVFEEPQPDLKKILDDALDLLSEQQRSILLLRDYEGYSYEEIGEILGLGESQVKVYLFRARQRIKAYLKDLEFVI